MFLRFLVVALALGGCDALTLTPSDEPFTDVDSAATPLVIDLAEADTVGLWGTRSMAFATEGGAVRRTEVRLDGQLVGAQDGPGPVQVSTEGWDDGAYDLEVRVLGSPETGSLGDQLGREVIVAEARRVAVVDNAPATAVDVVAVGPQDGALRVVWARYGRHNFERAIVERRFWNGSFVDVGRIDQRGQTWWMDETYLGERATYRVRLHAGGQTVLGAPFEVEVGAPEIVSMEHEGDGRVRIAWSAMPFTTAFDRYELRQDVRRSATVVATATDPADTTATVQVEDVFGQPFPFLLMTHGANNRRMRREFDVYVDPASSLGWKLVDVPARGAVFGLAGIGRVALVDATTLQVLASGSLPEGTFVQEVASSPSGRLVVLGIRVGRTYVFEFDPSTLAVVREVDVTDWLEGGELDVGSAEGLSDDGVLVFGVSPRRYNEFEGAHVVAVDVATGEKVWGLRGLEQGSAYGGPEAVSADGRYVAIGEGRTTFYEVDPTAPGGHRLVGRLPGELSADAITFAGPRRIAVIRTEFDPSITRVLDVLAFPSFELLSSTPLDGQPTRLWASEVGGTAHVAADADGGLLLIDAATGARVAAFDAVVTNGFALAAGAVWDNGRHRRY